MIHHRVAQKSLGTFGKVVFEASHVSSLGMIFVLFCASCLLRQIGAFDLTSNRAPPRHQILAMDLAKITGVALVSSMLSNPTLLPAAILAAIWAQMLNWTLTLGLGLLSGFIGDKISSKWKGDEKSSTKKGRIFVVVKILATTLIAEAMLVVLSADTRRINMDATSVKSLGFLFYVCFMWMIASYSILCPKHRLFHLRQDNNKGFSERNHIAYYRLYVLVLFFPATAVLVYGKVLYALSLLTSQGLYAQLDQGDELLELIMLSPMLWQVWVVTFGDLNCAIMPSNRFSPSHAIEGRRAQTVLKESWLLCYAALLVFCILSFRQVGHMVGFMISSVIAVQCVATAALSKISHDRVLFKQIR